MATIKTEQVKCPNCGHSIDVNDILYHQLQEQFQQDFNSKLAEEERKYNDKTAALAKQKQEIDKKSEELNTMIDQGVKKQLSAEKLTLEKKIRQEIVDEKSEEIKVYQEKLKEKTEEIKQYNKLKADFAQMSREKDELKTQIEAEAQIMITKALAEAKEKITKTVQDENELRFSEKERLIGNLTEQLREMQRKAEQGSMQSQGETQELAIEAFLKENFPLDNIDEIKKGARGADCLQIVNTYNKKNCGAIYYESKRTKDFQPSWIEKFKEDMRIKGAVFGVLVTEAMPKDMERLGQKEGIWVCSFQEFKGLCQVLRETVIHLSDAMSTQENKGDKMNMLYNFLTGNEFRMQVEAIVEGFTQMKQDLEREKLSITGHWKRREKQIQKVLLNTTNMYNSIRGIAGNAIGTIQALELPEPDKE